MDLITALIWIAVILFITVSVVVAWIIRMSMVFKYRIRFFYKLSGENQYYEGKTYRARKVLLSRAGVPRLWCPGLKEYVSFFGKKMGKNKLYYAEGPDGYLYNIVLGDLDTSNGILDIEPIEKDMRDFYITNWKNILENYNKQSKWPVVLQAVTFIIIALILVGGGYLLYGKINEGIELTNTNVELGNKLAENQLKISVATNDLIQELKGGGSGIEPAPTPPG